MSDACRPFPEQIDDCLARCDQALQRGRPAEAQRYLALARTLRRLAREFADDAAPTPATTPPASEVHEVHGANAPVVAAPPPSKVTEVHEVHALTARIAELEARILKRQRLGAPANDLRRQLIRLRAQPPP